MKKIEVEIATTYGPEKRTGYTDLKFPGLCVHRDLAREDEWRVTHTATGLAVTPKKYVASPSMYFPTRKAAAAWAAELSIETFAFSRFTTPRGVKKALAANWPEIVRTTHPAQYMEIR